MANPKHLRILQQGVETWNAWRKQHRNITPDFRNAPLSLTNLCRADMHNANLSGADLHGVSFREANLQGADLTDTTGLLPRQLAGADVSDARLPAKFPLFTALDHVQDLSDS